MTHRTETDGTPGNYTAHCLDCGPLGRYPTLSEAVRVAGKHHRDNHPEKDEH